MEIVTVNNKVPLSVSGFILTQQRLFPVTIWIDFSKVSILSVVVELFDGLEVGDFLL